MTDEHQMKNPSIANPPSRGGADEILHRFFACRRRIKSSARGRNQPACSIAPMNQEDASRF
jgi:hypothetical protein